MKKSVIVTAILSITLFSCSKKESAETTTDTTPTTETTTTTTTTTAPTTDATATPATPSTPEAEGKALIEGADCLSCHKVDSKLIGPAYKDVAAKYTEADIDKLSQKIIDGGKGVWGDVEMTPHAGMSKENAQKMVKYILSLKK